MISNSVEWFAERMEDQLQANDDKGHWDGLDPLWLYAKLGEEIGEVGDALNSMFDPHGETRSADYLTDGWRADFVRECADVANLAMMLADEVGGKR